jgi:hypothetical protein
LANHSGPPGRLLRRSNEEYCTVRYDGEGKYVRLIISIISSKSLPVVIVLLLKVSVPQEIEKRREIIKEMTRNFFCIENLRIV